MGLLANDTLQMVIEGKCFGQDIQYTQSWKLSANGPGGTTVAQDLLTLCNDVINNIGTAIMTNYLSMLAPNYSLSNVTFQKIAPVRSAYQFINAGVQGGTFAGTATIAADAACITFIGALGNRHNVSNKHIGPLADQASAAGLVVGAFKGAAGNFITSILTGWVPTGFGAATMISGVWDRVGLVFTPYTTGTVQDETRVQRRRVVGYGK